MHVLTKKLPFCESIINTAKNKKTFINNILYSAGVNYSVTVQHHLTPMTKENSDAAPAWYSMCTCKL